MSSGEDHNSNWRETGGGGGGGDSTTPPPTNEYVLVIRSRAKQQQQQQSSSNDDEMGRSVRGSFNALIPQLTTQEQGLGLGPNEMIMQAMSLLSSVAEKHALPLHIQKGTD